MTDLLAPTRFILEGALQWELTSTPGQAVHGNSSEAPNDIHRA